MSGSGPAIYNLRAHCRTRLAGFKVPKRALRVPEIHRSPAGKPDGAWARAAGQTTGVAG